MNRMQRMIVAGVMGMPLIVNAQGTSQSGALHQPTEGRVTNAVVGDRACYLTLQDDLGRVSEEYATFEICEQKPSVIGQRVVLTYKMGEVNSQSCGGDPICAQHDRVPLVVHARILNGPKPKAPTPDASGRLCANDEQVVFACKTGEKAVSVCASREASQTSGYLQYRFGKPGAPEMTLPATRLIPPQAATGAPETYAGGGAAWLRFRQGTTRYVVYTGIGRWGPKGETREVAGVVVEQSRVANRNLKCVGKVTSLLGPDWFGTVGIQRQSPDESFELPVP